MKNNNKPLREIPDKSPLETLQKYKTLLDSLDQLIKASKLTVKEIEEICQISESQYHRRKNNADLWTYSELNQLIKKIEQRLKQHKT